jgi:hypothetical protein
MAKEIKNIGASVRARLLQFAKTSGQSFRFGPDTFCARATALPDQSVASCQPLRAERCDANDELV